MKTVFSWGSVQNSKFLQNLYLSILETFSTINTESWKKIKTTFGLTGISKTGQKTKGSNYDPSTISIVFQFQSKYCPHTSPTAYYLHFIQLEKCILFWDVSVKNKCIEKKFLLLTSDNLYKHSIKIIVQRSMVIESEDICIFYNMKKLCSGSSIFIWELQNIQKRNICHI